MKNHKQMLKRVLIVLPILVFTGCADVSSYSKSKPTTKCKVKAVSIDSISSSHFWKMWQKEYFEDSLEDALYKQCRIKVVRNSYYKIYVDLYDYSSTPKEKMGKFLGQKQYRIIQDYDVHAWYRIKERGTGKVLKDGKVRYSPYSDTGSSRSFEDAKKLVIKKKLKGIANKVAQKMVNYFK